MKVKELIKVLQEFDENKEICIFRAYNGTSYPIDCIYEDDLDGDVFIDLELE